MTYVMPNGIEEALRIVDSGNAGPETLIPAQGFVHGYSRRTPNHESLPAEQAQAFAEGWRLDNAARDRDDKAKFVAAPV